MADDEFDEEEWERGKNAADDQFFRPSGVFTEYCIQSHNGGFVRWVSRVTPSHRDRYYVPRERIIIILVHR
jgi:hypothetical protein